MMETIPEEDHNCNPRGKMIHLQLNAISVSLPITMEDRKNKGNETIIGDIPLGNIRSDLSNPKSFQQPVEVDHKSEILLSTPAEIQENYSTNSKINTCNIVNEQKTAIQDRTLKGESEPQTFEKSRRNTDILWLFFFLSFAFAWLCLGVYVGASSKTASFLSTYSSYKEECPSGDKKFLMYFGLANYFKNSKISSLTDIYIHSKFCPTGKVCVSKCPTTIWTAELFLTHITSFNYSLIQHNMICVSNEIKKNITTLNALKDVVNKNLCVREYSFNIPVLNLCLPYELLMNLIATKSKWNMAINIAEFIYLCILENVLYVQMIFTSSCLLMMIYVSLLYWIAAPLLWLTVISFIFFAIIGLIYSALCYFGIESTYNIFLKFYKIWLINGESLLSLISFILAAVLLLAVIKNAFDLIRLKHYIKPGLIFIKESCRIVLQTKGSLFFIFIVIHICFALLLWTWSVMICLLNDSNQDYKIQNQNTSPCNCTGEYKNATEGNKCLPGNFSQFCSNCICSKSSAIKFYFFIVLRIFNLFAVVWATIFIHAFSKMVLTYSLSRWYYNADKEELQPFLIISSTKIILRYHLGTAAHGSFGILQSAIYKIIALIRMCPDLKHLFCSNDVNLSAPMHKYSLIICAVNGTDLKNSTEKLNSIDIIEDGGRKELNKAAQKMLTIIKWTICTVLMIFLFLISHKRAYSSEISLHFLCFCIYLISTVYIQVCKTAVDTLMYCYIQDQNSKSKFKKCIPENLKSFFEKQESFCCKNHQDQDSSENLGIYR